LLPAGIRGKHDSVIESGQRLGRWMEEAIEEKLARGAREESQLK